MRKLIIVFALMASVSNLLMAQKIKGSDTCLPLSQKEAESYQKTNPSANVTVTGGGSGVGISALIEGTTDIAQSSRKIKFDERQKMQESGKSVKEVIVAYDALAVIVNPANTVEKLTREQLESVFTGKITNWKELGGADERIIPYARESSSGTFEFFKEIVLNNRNYMAGIMSMPATGAIVQSISQTKGAIGYVGLAYINNNIKAVKVSYDQGKNYVEPSVANAKNETYPIVRPLIYYYEAKSETTVKPFLDYVLSTTGQKIVEEIGFITLN